MKNIKHWLATIAVLLCSMVVNAQVFEVDDICYRVTSDTDLTVEVISRKECSGEFPNWYKGVVVIPEMVEYGGNTYRVTAIGNFAFEGCLSLTSVTIPESVTSISYSAFYNYYPLYVCSVKEVVLKSTTPPTFPCDRDEVPSHTSFIVPTSAYGDYISAWEELNEQITIDDVEARVKNVEITTSEEMEYTSALSLAIGEENLRYVTHLTVSGPINSDDFHVMLYEMPLLRYLDLGKASIVKGGRYDYVKEENIFPKDGLRNCNLQTLILPENITSIGDYAISWNENLSEIIIPENIVSIGNYSFYQCGSFRVYCHAKQIPSITSSTFPYGANSRMTLYVPEEMMEEYKSAEIWSDFGCILPMNMETVTSLNQLSNNKVYWVSQLYRNATSWAVAVGGDAMKANAELNISANPNDPCQQFAFISNDGGRTHYLYHVAEKKFVNMFGRLSEIPLTPIHFTEGAYENTFVVCFDQAHYVNVNSNPSLVIDSWVAPDGGNSCSFVPIGEFDPTAALAMLDKWLVRPEEGVVYRALANGEAELALASPSLKEIVIPTTVTIDGKVCKVTSVGDCAFLGCTNLVSVTVPEGVVEIGNNAFQDCSSLISFQSPRTTKMGENVFDGCNRLESLTFNSSSIKSSEFKGHPNLKEVVLGDNVMEIGESAFMECDSLVSITISSSVTKIGNDAFTECGSLREVVLEDGSEPLSLGYVHSTRRFEFDGESWRDKNVGLFFDCPLEKVYLGRDLRYVNPSNSSYYIEPWQKLFFGQTNLKSVTIGKTVTEIGYSTFGTCSNLAEVHISDVAAWCNIQFVEANSNPLYLAKHLYLNGKLVTEITIPEGVTSIGNYAFYNYSSLSAINFPESIEAIGIDAFSGTAWYDNLPDGLLYTGKVLYKYVGEMPENTSIKVKEGTTCIYESAFEGEENLVSITIPESVTDIQTGAFKGCNGLTSIAFPKNVRSLGDYAFYGCSSLTSLDTGDAVFEGDSILVGCNKIERIALNVSRVGEWFYDNLALKEVVLGDRLSSFYSYPAFYGCDNLERVTLNCSNVRDWLGRNTTVKEIVLGEGVTMVENRAFAYCTNLTSITIGKNVTKIGELGKSCVVFDGCTSLRKVIFEDGGDTLELGCNGTGVRFSEGLFYYCPLDSVYLGRNLSYETGKRYGYSPFYNKKAATSFSLTIGPGVTEIATDAFYYSNLTSVTCYAMTPPTCYSGAFNTENTEIPVYAPSTSLAEYQEAEVWKDFLNFIGIEAGVPIILTIGENGSNTFCSKYPLDFSQVDGLKAYVATGYNTNTGVVTLTRVMTSKPGEGLFIKGEPGSYKVFTRVAGSSMLNLLVGTIEEVVVNGTSSDGLSVNYEYGIREEYGSPMFYKVSEGSILEAGKAYLQLPKTWLGTGTTRAAIGLHFDDEEEMEFGDEEQPANIVTPEVIYDLQGRRVTNPTKGVFIVNGKKVVLN